jgi:hypothetical protein
MRHVVGGRAVERQAASTSQVARFETDVLTHLDNLTALMNMPVQWVDMIQQRRPIKQRLLDMDSSVSATHGEQEGAMYNGHFGCDCYHPLFIFNQDWRQDGPSRPVCDVSIGRGRRPALAVPRDS